MACKICTGKVIIFKRSLCVANEEEDRVCGYRYMSVDPRLILR